LGLSLDDDFESPPPLSLVAGLASPELDAPDEPDEPESEELDSEELFSRWRFLVP
jgi:hypothetical protein